MIIKPQLSFFKFVKTNSWFGDLSQWGGISLNTKDLYNYKLLSEGINLHQMIFAYYLVKEEVEDNIFNFDKPSVDDMKASSELVQVITNLSAVPSQRKLTNKALVSMIYDLFVNLIADISITGWDVMDYKQDKNNSYNFMFFNVLPLALYSLARKHEVSAAGNLLQFLSIMTFPNNSLDKTKERYLTGDSLIIECIEKHDYNSLELFKNVVLLGLCVSNYRNKKGLKQKGKFYLDALTHSFVYFNSKMSKLFLGEHFEKDAVAEMADMGKHSAAVDLDFSDVIEEYRHSYEKLFMLDEWSLNSWTMDNVLALKDKYPWFEDLIDQVVLDLSASNKISNLLLVGMPGCGKTSFCHDLAKAMDISYDFVSVAGSSDNRNLLGTSSGFANAMPAMPTRSLYNNGIINPLIVVDEIDKAGGDGVNGSVHDAISQFIEKSSSKRFYDECLSKKIHISHINWMFTANRTDDLPSFLQSRLNIVPVKKPSMEHLDLVVDSLTQDWVNQRNIGEYADEFEHTSLICQRIKKSRRDFDVDIRDVSKEVNQAMSQIFQSKKESIIQRQREKLQNKSQSVYKARV